ncbi:hypothetical protein NITGR_390007 [Nitrospina gracilis 3/211]|uniref:Uncharacterized protein n=1 Tax=Nitrospina gracilis (strain 3/211) TaxID=1266370 RepID=M1YZ82_NITG3|nr:hypothetical protein NITGR_390007 [Nitrospina gracilis 3/211]
MRFFGLKTNGLKSKDISPHFNIQ